MLKFFLVLSWMLILPLACGESRLERGYIDRFQEGARPIGPPAPEDVLDGEEDGWGQEGGGEDLEDALFLDSDEGDSSFEEDGRSDDSSGDGSENGSEMPTLYPPLQVQSPITPYVASRLQEIAALDPQLDERVFMKVGASSFAQVSFMRCFSGSYDLSSYSSLESTRLWFDGGDAAGTSPFSRASLAAVSGKTASWALSGNPSPMESEYLATEPLYAFVMFGANDMGAASSYEKALFLFAENLWTLTDELLSWGVVPVLLSISRRLDHAPADPWVGSYNLAIRAIAQGRQIPFVDIFEAFRGLPNEGLSSDGLHASVFPGGACVLDEAGLAYGHNVRNKELLLMLSRLKGIVSDEEAQDLDEGIYLEGEGSMAQPFEIPNLPFVDLQDSSLSPHQALSHYSGCEASQDESGPEWIYSLQLETRTKIRAAVHDLGNTDIDIHILEDSPREDNCIARDHEFLELTLEPGRYYFVLDTFVSASGRVNEGEFLFTLEECKGEGGGC